MSNPEFRQKLQELASELRHQNNQLALHVRESGRKTQESFEDLLEAIHRMHAFLNDMPQRLEKIADELEAT